MLRTKSQIKDNKSIALRRKNRELFRFLLNVRGLFMKVCLFEAKRSEPFRRRIRQAWAVQMPRWLLCPLLWIARSKEFFLCTQIIVETVL